MSGQNSGNQPKEEVTFRQMFAILLGIGAIVIYQRVGSVQRFYFLNYEYLWGSLFAFIVVLIAVAIWQIMKRTKSLSDRMGLLGEAAKKYGSIYVGNSGDGVRLYLSEEQRTGHVQVLGSTGRGKTESVIVSWLFRDLKNGKNALLIDGKGDPGLVRHITSISKYLMKSPRIVTFDLGNPAASCTTNPIGQGSAQQITDRLFTAFQFDDSYYKSVQSDVTLSVIQLVQGDGGQVTFRRIYELLTDDVILSKAVSQTKNDVLRAKLTRFLAEPRAQRAEKLSGLLSQIAPFAVGEIAELVNGETPGKENFDLCEIVLSRKRECPTVFIVLIPTLKYQDIGHQLGRLFLQELGWAVGERASQSQNGADFIPVYLDEFSAFVYPKFVNILNKARSSNVALHLSHQSLGDLGMVSDDFAQIINTNTNVKCIFGVNDPESADWMAAHLGTSTTEKLTERAQSGFLTPRQKTGDVSIREVEAYKVHPNLLKNFTHGRGVLHFPTQRGSLTEVIQFERLGSADVTGEHD